MAGSSTTSANTLRTAVFPGKPPRRRDCVCLTPFARQSSWQKLAGSHAVLPFDPVLEAENLGARVTLDDSPLGPRKACDAVTSIEQLADLPRLDVTKGRLSETISAIRLINDGGGKASMEIHGPIPS